MRDLTVKQTDKVYSKRLTVTLFWAVVLLALYLSSLYNYLLFHTTAELFSAAVAFCIFMIAWNTREMIPNAYLVFVGIGYFFSGSVDLLHAMAYEGMNIFNGFDPDLATQLWILGRYTQSASLLGAVFFIRRKVNAWIVFSVFSVLTVFLLFTIFYFRIFPTCFVEGEGLTPFKIFSEYIIAGILAISGILVWRLRAYFDEGVLKYLLWSIVMTIVSEIFFTQYVSTYGFSNLLGHYFKVFSFYLMYRAMIKTGLERPYSLLLRDIKLSEEVLRNERDRAQKYLDVAGVLLIVLDLEGKVVLINRRGCVLLGAWEIEIIGKKWFDTFTPPKYREEAWSLFRRIMSGERREPEHFQGGVVAKDGEVRVISWHYTLLKNDEGEIKGILVSGEDITDLVKAEKALRKHRDELEQLVTERTCELREKNEELRQLYRKLAEAETIERKNISRELHDLVGQKLTALGINLNILKMKMPRDGFELQHQRINDSLVVLEETTEHIRDVMAELRPPVLDDYGILAAIQWYAKRYTERTGITAVVEGVDFDQQPDAFVQNAFYRIVLESLNNIAKHSGAKNVFITLRCNLNKCALEIEDDGAGFDPVSHRGEEGTAKWGLKNMEERAASIGAVFEINSAPGKGTVVTVEVQL